MMVTFSEDHAVFSLKTALLLILWLLLALAQWLIVCLIERIRVIFFKSYIICMVTFMLAILLFAVLLFTDKVRVHKIATLLLTVIIAELQIISLFTLVAHTAWNEMLLSFVICVVLLIVTAIIGMFLPEKLDLTPNLPQIIMFLFGGGTHNSINAPVHNVQHPNHIWRQIRRDESRRVFFGIPDIVPRIPHYLLDDFLLADRTREKHLLAPVNVDNGSAYYTGRRYGISLDFKKEESRDWMANVFYREPEGKNFPYKEDREKFTLNTFLLLVLWLILALIQWLMVCHDKSMGKIFRDHYGICIVTFLVAFLLFAVLLFIQKVRANKVAAPILTVVIAELQIVSLFYLVAHAHWADFLLSFVICVILLIVFAAIGNALPEEFDLTLYIALIFIVHFLLLLIAIFFLMMHLMTVLIGDTSDYSFILVQIPITVSMLLFVMYHTQTISGGRFHEMSLDEVFLASLLLFHDFLIIFWLSCNWLINYLINIYWAAAHKKYDWD